MATKPKVNFAYDDDADADPHADADADEYVLELEEAEEEVAASDADRFACLFLMTLKMTLQHCNIVRAVKIQHQNCTKVVTALITTASQEEWFCNCHSHSHSH